MTYPSKKTFNQFISEAYPRAERYSHNTKPPKVYHNTPIIPKEEPYKNPDRPRTELAPPPPGVNSPKKRKIMFSLGPEGLEV